MKNKRGLLSCFIIIFTIMVNLRVYAADIPSSKRIAGDNRYSTAVEISKEGWQTSNNVIIATGEDFPDALCAAPLAKQLDAPILLTGKNTLNANTSLELTRLIANKVYIIGGPGVVSDTVKQQIESKGIACERICGNNRYATSIEVAKHLNLAKEIVVATGNDFPDALSIAPIAAKNGIPIILTNKTNLTDDVMAYINSKNITKSYIIGGTGVITDNVKAQLPFPDRIYGSNRYETNISILNRFNSELNFATSYLATGNDFPDALAGSSLAPKSMSPIILTSKTPGTVTKNYILSKLSLITSLNTLGGTGAIPDNAISILLGIPFTDYNKLGNSIGNVNNKGMFVLNNDWLYTNTIDSEYIHKMKIDGTLKKMLNLQPSAYLNVTNNYIFYVNLQDNYRLYRMNTDGSHILCINTKDEVQNLIVYNDNIYYSNYNDNGKIYRVKFDGSGRTKITDDPSCRYVNIAGNYLYYSAYSAENGGGPLYRVNLDGTNRKLINGDKCSYEILKNGVIYFINESDNFNLYKMNYDGTGCKKLNDDNCGFLNISDNVLYYSNWYDNGRIYGIKIDGTLRTSVTTEAAYYLNIVGDKIYYKTKSDYGDTHSTSIINLDTNEIPNDSSSLGNLPGNINNEATFAVSDGKNMYVNEYGIYRYNTDYTNKLYIGHETPGGINYNYLNVSNGWVYYAEMSTSTISGKERIYKIKADGSGQKVELSSNRAFYMTVAGDWIYYTTVESDLGAGPIHKVRTDGTGETYVDIKNFDYAAYLNVSGDYIYYVNSKDNMTIYKVKIDGTGREKVLDEPARGLNVMGGYIYYSSNINGQLKRMPIGGGPSTTLINNAYDNFIVTSNKIYYVALSSVYCSNLDGSSETFITNCTIRSQINIAGDYLYYKDDSGKINVLKVQ